MATHDPFVHLERLYAEALLRHTGLLAEPVAAPRRIARGRLLLLLLPYALILAAGVALLARQPLAATYLLASITALSPLILLLRVSPLRERLGLTAPSAAGAAFELLLSGALLLALTVLPELLPPLALLFTLRTLYAIRHRIRDWTDRATIRLERERLTRGTTPRIYGLVDERHGGDATRLAHHGEAVARLRGATREPR